VIDSAELWEFLREQRDCGDPNRLSHWEIDA